MQIDYSKANMSQLAKYKLFKPKPYKFFNQITTIGNCISKTMWHKY